MSATSVARARMLDMMISSRCSVSVVLADLAQAVAGAIGDGRQVVAARFPRRLHDPRASGSDATDRRGDTNRVRASWRSVAIGAGVSGAGAEQNAADRGREQG